MTLRYALLHTIASLEKLAASNDGYFESSQVEPDINVLPSVLLEKQSKVKLI